MELVKCECHDQSANCSCLVHLCVNVHKEGSVLFNDALNTFYLRLYGVR